VPNLSKAGSRQSAHGKKSTVSSNRSINNSIFEQRKNSIEKKTMLATESSGFY
jgi:hypothetical protein